MDDKEYYKLLRNPFVAFLLLAIMPLPPSWYEETREMNEVMLKLVDRRKYVAT